MNKLFSKILTKGLVGVVVASAAMMFSLGGTAHAAACYQYDPNGTVTSATPVFNNFCNVPYGVGDEADFVRVRQSSNGNVEDNQNNPDYVNTLNAACNIGDKYDVHTYIHNNAMDANNGNGAGSAVAHNVQLAMTAPLNKTQPNNSFTFGSTVTATNVASVHDTAMLNCGGVQKQLSLVPGTVHIYSQQYNWHVLDDSAVNGTTKIGSPVLGSGDQWGCWDYRIVVVYQVQVKPVVPPVSTGDCQLVDVVVGDNRSVKVKVTGVTSNASIVGYSIDFGDGTIVNQQSADHTYAKDGTYNIVTKVQVKFADGHLEWKTAATCAKQVVFTPGKPPVVPPTAKLVDTGPGDVAAIFAATSVAGALAYRVYVSRRLSRQ